jgi:hypothetical protein
MQAGSRSNRRSWLANLTAGGIVRRACSARDLILKVPAQRWCIRQQRQFSPRHSLWSRRKLACWRAVMKAQSARQYQDQQEDR